MTYRPARTAMLLSVLLWSSAAAALAGQRDPVAAPRADTLYQQHCSRCHGPAGSPPKSVAADRIRPYDFSKCSLASAEPDTAWLIAVTQGGPAVGLSSDMPAFKDRLPPDDIRAVVSYLRGLCIDQGWPNGNLNL